MGESSRSLTERHHEHLQDFIAQKEESHMWTHARDNLDGNINFKIKQIKSHKNEMMHQISDTVQNQVPGWDESPQLKKRIQQVSAPKASS